MFCQCVGLPLMFFYFKIQDPYVLLLRSYQNLDKRDCDWQEAKYVLSYFGKGVL